MADYNVQESTLNLMPRWPELVYDRTSGRDGFDQLQYNSKADDLLQSISSFRAPNNEQLQRMEQEELEALLVQSRQLLKDFADQETCFSVYCEVPADEGAEFRMEAAIDEIATGSSASSASTVAASGSASAALSSADAASLRAAVEVASGYM